MMAIMYGNGSPPGSLLSGTGTGAGPGVYGKPTD